MGLFSKKKKYYDTKCSIACQTCNHIITNTLYCGKCRLCSKLMCFKECFDKRFARCIVCDKYACYACGESRNSGWKCKLCIGKSSNKTKTKSNHSYEPSYMNTGRSVYKCPSCGCKRSNGIGRCYDCNSAMENILEYN